MVGIRDTPSFPLSSPSEAEASLMEEKRLLPQPPPWTHYIFGFLTLPNRNRLGEVLHLAVDLHLPPCGGWTSAAAAAPDESDALHLCNHRQLVPSDYAPLNAVLSAVAHSNTERD